MDKGSLIKYTLVFVWGVSIGVVASIRAFDRILEEQEADEAKEKESSNEEKED